MARLIVLGSAGAVSDAQHHNTHFVLQGDHTVVLVDCGSNPVVKLRRFSIHYDQLTDIILTHFHPDHVYGMPMLLMHMWLIGRQKPIRVYGLHHCLERTEDLMAAFSWASWPQFFPVAFHRIPFREEQLVLENIDFKITSWPVQHFNVPSIGLRIENKVSGKIVGYSCDTAPIPNVVRLAYQADLLFHEASGKDAAGYSTAAQAGEMAREGHCKRLVLIYNNLEGSRDAKSLIEEAARTFDGAIETATDYSVYDF